MMESSSDEEIPTDEDYDRMYRRSVAKYLKEQREQGRMLSMKNQLKLNSEENQIISEPSQKKIKHTDETTKDE